MVRSAVTPDLNVVKSAVNFDEGVVESAVCPARTPSGYGLSRAPKARAATSAVYIYIYIFVCLYVYMYIYIYIYIHTYICIYIYISVAVYELSRAPHVRVVISAVNIYFSVADETLRYQTFSTSTVTVRL